MTSYLDCGFSSVVMGCVGVVAVRCRVSQVEKKFVGVVWES